MTDLINTNTMEENTMEQKFEGFKATIKELMTVNTPNGRYTMLQYIKADRDEWCIALNYDPITRSWDAGNYAYTYEAALITMLRKMESKALKSDTEKQSGISWDRMSEIATQVIEGLFADGTEEAIEYLKETVELEENEADYFEIKNKLFPKKYKIVELTLKREQYARVKVAIPQDEDDYNATNYVDYWGEIEPEDEDTEWEEDDRDVIREEMTKEDIEYRYDQDSLWNFESFDEQ